MRNDKGDVSVEIAYPFSIYKGVEAIVGHVNEPLIHINTLAQLSYRACSEDKSMPAPLLIIKEKNAVEGVSGTGYFKLDFANNYIKKVRNLESSMEDDVNRDFRLGLVHDMDNKIKLSRRVESFHNAILLHGDLKGSIQIKEMNSKKLTIQWITE